MIVPTGPSGAIDYDELATLKELALRGGLGGTVTVSSTDLAEYFDVSKQTTARRLRRLLDTGHIDRELVAGGQRVTITDRGRAALRDELEEYRRVFEPAETLAFAGVVVGGMGEGRHYISLPGYRRQFEERLGYEPYPGTLNVDLDEESVSKLGRLDRCQRVRIEEWTDDERTYGGATCYPATVAAAAGDGFDQTHVIVPDRTHHDRSQLEVIAPVELRAELDLRDDDGVTIDVRE